MWGRTLRLGNRLDQHLFGQQLAKIIDYHTSGIAIGNNADAFIGRKQRNLHRTQQSDYQQRPRRNCIRYGAQNSQSSTCSIGRFEHLEHSTEQSEL